MPKSINETVEILAKEWGNLSVFLRYTYFTSFTLLLILWIYPNASNTYIELSAPKGMTFINTVIALVFLAPLLNWLWSNLKVFYYRKRYPISKYDEDYTLAWFPTKPGALCIVHKKRKEINWVENPQTAVDLRFFPIAWSHAEGNDLKSKINIGDKPVNIKRFSKKRSIRTRGKPNNFDNMTS